jgi:hypothetical protein
VFDMQMFATLRRYPGRAAVVAVVLAAVGGFGLYWFAPWNLLVDRRVDEALPSVGAPVGKASAEDPAEEPAGEDGTAGDGAGETDGQPVEGSGPATLAEGDFTGLEHASTGTAQLVEFPGGSRYLRLEDLETSNGPDLRVILSDQPPSEDWRVWDDGQVLDLGGLKGNLGSSNYEIGKDVDLSEYRTAVIWCRRFSVGFAVAPLEPAG